MLSVALLSILVPTAGAADITASATLMQQSNLPVQVWLNKQDVDLGDRVRAYARTDTDGYLLVLHAEPDGRVRVLFPVDPVDDNFVRGGQDIEILGRGNREAFRIYASSGVGTVYAAFSRDPFVFDQFLRAEHWDYGLPDTWLVLNDAEADLTDIAVTMASGAYFDYDIVQYGVGQVVAESQAASPSLTYYGNTYVGAAPGAWGWGGWGYPYGWGLGVGFGFGGFNIGFSWGWGGYYGYPYHYGYYDPYHYGHGYYGGYYPVRAVPYYGGHTYASYNPRLRYTPQVSPYNSRSRTRRVYAASPTSSGARRLTGSVTPTSRGATAATRRVSPTAATTRRVSPTSRTVNTATRRSASPVTRSTSSPSPVTRRTTTSSRRGFPQQPARTEPARRSEATDGLDRRSSAATTPVEGVRSQPTARRVTSTRPPSPNSARVSPTTRSTAGSARARPVRQTGTRPQVTSPRRVTPTTIRPSSGSRSARTTPTARRPTTQQSRVSPSYRAPSRRQPATLQRSPTRITAPTMRRPSPATNFKTSIKTTTRTTVRTTPRRRRP